MSSHSALVLLLLTSCILTPGCRREASDAKQAGANEEKVGPPVTVSLVERKVTARTISIVAELRGVSQVDVFSKFIGKISFLGPKEGAHVARGETLFRVDRNDPGETFLNAPVESPIEGWVGHWNVVNVGWQIATDDPVVTIVDDSALRATVYLPLEKWTMIRNGTRVFVAVDGERRPGKVVGIARSAESGTGRGSAIIETANPTRSWRAGMVAKITLEIDPRDRILIPAAALSITDQGAFVYLVAEGKAKRQKVKFEVVDADFVEIIDGITENSRLVIAGGNLVSDGHPVKVTSEVTAKGHL